MKILSLFDGISCGRVAFERAGIPVTEYHACEIDKYAIQVSQKNYPDIIRHGSVVDYHPERHFDYLIGGSPCQGFSFAGKQLAFNDPRSKLFFEYVRILNECRAINPNIKFLLENVRMKQEYRQVITDTLAVEPVRINSALVSAQNRVRDYWANWLIRQPNDKGIVLNDILVNGTNFISEKFIKPIRISEIKNGGIGNRIYSKAGKGVTLLYNSGGTAGRGNFLVSVYEKPHGFNSEGHKKVDKFPALRSCSQYNYPLLNKETDDAYRRLEIVECERLQNLPDGFTEGVSVPQRHKTIANGWTVDIIAHALKSSKE